MNNNSIVLGMLLIVTTILTGIVTYKVIINLSEGLSAISTNEVLNDTN